MFAETVISLIPMVPSYWAWRLSRRDADPVNKARRLLFDAGLLVSLTASALIIGSWLEPFRLIEASGGYSNVRNDELSLAAFAAAVLAVALSFLGMGRARLLSLLSGCCLVLLSIAAFISKN